MLSDFDIEIYKALSDKRPRDAQYVHRATGRSIGGARDKMNKLSQQGYLIRTSKADGGRLRPMFTLTDTFSIAYSKATGETVELSEASKAIMRMRSHRLA